MVIRQLEELNIASSCEPICAALSVVSGDPMWPFPGLSVVRAGTDDARANSGRGWDVTAAHTLSKPGQFKYCLYFFFAISSSVCILSFFK